MLNFIDNFMRLFDGFAHASFEDATPEALARALLRPVQAPKDAERRGVSVQLGRG